jgi:hypothetical protein
MKHWINAVSKDHVLSGMEGGFTQANHGSAANLRRLASGDLIAFYSSGTRFRKGELIHMFTAVARVIDDKVYQVQVTRTFHPWRRRVTPLPCEDAAITPLIETLDFIKDKTNWGLPFRRGLFEIGADDFRQIADAMKCDVVVKP